MTLLAPLNPRWPKGNQGAPSDETSGAWKRRNPLFA